jgi:hypothetical protein
LLQRADYQGARAVLEEGLLADTDNVELYLTLDGVLSALEAPARERAAALGQFPASGANIPASLIFKRALALSEAGDATGANNLFRDRFFPREEGGTNVRTIYAQVQLTSARLAADGGRCVAATTTLDSLSTDVPGLPFTKGGVADAVASPVLALQAADIESRCGRKTQAQARWDTLARPLPSASAPLPMAIADAAARRLGRPRTPAERTRLEQAIERATTTLESAGTSSPGQVEYARGALLAALGKNSEARKSLQRVFTYPDRGLSHTLAREELKHLIQQPSKSQ